MSCLKSLLQTCGNFSEASPYAAQSLQALEVSSNKNTRCVQFSTFVFQISFWVPKPKYPQHLLCCFLFAKSHLFQSSNLLPVPLYLQAENPRLCLKHKSTHHDMKLLCPYHLDNLTLTMLSTTSLRRHSQLFGCEHVGRMQE